MDALEKVEQLRVHAVMALDFLEDWIEKYGDQRTRSQDRTNENLVHDFICFSLTKAARTLDSAFGLLGHARAEDALILARGAYECYLHASYIGANPEEVDAFVQSKLAAYSGEWKHPETKKGKKVWRYVVDPYTGERYPHGCSIKELVDNGRSIEDRAVHDGLYGFLSEYDHLHMISVGAYCNDEYSHFVLNKPGSMLFPAFLYCSYIVWLITSEAATCNECGGISKEDADILFALRDMLISLVREAEVDEQLKELSEAMEKRLLAQDYSVFVSNDDDEGVFDANRKRFRDEFARDPGGNEPLFWDPDAAVPERFNSSQYEEMVKFLLDEGELSRKEKQVVRNLLLGR